MVHPVQRLTDHFLHFPSAGEIAPGAIIDCVEAACKGPWEAGRRTEQKLFVPLVSSPESAALRHMFAAERAGKASLPCFPFPQLLFKQVSTWTVP